MRQLSSTRPLGITVYEALRDSICTGELPEGERLIQSDLADRLGTSRLPVHAALQRLQVDGFVIETGRRGLVVSPLKPDFVRDLFELRAALDRTAGQSAARSHRPGDLTRGRTMIERGRKGLASGNLRAVASADQDFHALIYRMGGNGLIAAAAERNWHHVRRAFFIVVGLRPELSLFWEDHAPMLDAIAAGDAGRAGELCAGHAIRSGKSYAATLAGRADDLPSTVYTVPKPRAVR